MFYLFPYGRLLNWQFGQAFYDTYILQTWVQSSSLFSLAQSTNKVSYRHCPRIELAHYIADIDVWNSHHLGCPSPTLHFQIGTFQPYNLVHCSKAATAHCLPLFLQAARQGVFHLSGPLIGLGWNVTYLFVLRANSLKFDLVKHKWPRNLKAFHVASRPFCWLGECYYVYWIWLWNDKLFCGCNGQWRARSLLPLEATHYIPSTVFAPTRESVSEHLFRHLNIKPEWCGWWASASTSDCAEPGRSIDLVPEDMAFWPSRVGSILASAWCCYVKSPKSFPWRKRSSCMTFRSASLKI